jgi:hypothetical protein
MIEKSEVQAIRKAPHAAEISTFLRLGGLVMRRVSYRLCM